MGVIQCQLGELRRTKAPNHFLYDTKWDTFLEDPHLSSLKSSRIKYSNISPRKFMCIMIRKNEDIYHFNHQTVPAVSK